MLVDAPCSGTGTWRRNPEARWRLDEAELARLARINLADNLLSGELPLVRVVGDKKAQHRITRQ